MVVATTTRVREMTRWTEFDAFYRREHGRIFRALALTLGGHDLAAEAVDEAMVRAYQRWSRVSAYENASGWVYRVGLNWAISRGRRRGRRLPDTGGAVATNPPLPDPQLAAAVAALPTRHRP